MYLFVYSSNNLLIWSLKLAICNIFTQILKSLKERCFLRIHEIKLDSNLRRVIVGNPLLITLQLLSPHSHINKHKSKSSYGGSIFEGNSFLNLNTFKSGNLIGYKDSHRDLSRYFNTMATRIYLLVDPRVMIECLVIDA